MPTWPHTLSITVNELCGEGLVWLIVVVVCLHAALLVQLFVRACSKWPHSVLRVSLANGNELPLRDCKSATMLEWLLQAALWQVVGLPFLLQMRH